MTTAGPADAAHAADAVGSSAPSVPSHLARLDALIERAAHLLPAQGPINQFIHHNTLHAFEDLPFERAVEEAARAFGCEPYMSEDRYRHELGRGRIRVSELQDVLAESLGGRADESVPPGCTRFDLRSAMLQYPLWTGPAREVTWFMAETDAVWRVRPEASAAARQRLIAETRRWVLRDVRPLSAVDRPAGGAGYPRHEHRARRALAGIFHRLDDAALESWSEQTWETFTLQALWRFCCDGVRAVPPPAYDGPRPVRLRDRLKEVTGVDPDDLVHALLIRFCPAFLDQGVAHWQLPGRAAGFYRSFLALYRLSRVPRPRWMNGLGDVLAGLADRGASPLEVIDESLAALGVPGPDVERFVADTLLALRGWGGILAQVAARGDRVVRPVPPGTVREFLAVRLLLDRWAAAHVARESLGYRGPLAALARQLADEAPRPDPPATEQRAFVVFQLAQVLSWTPEDLHRLGRAEWAALLRDIEGFTGYERRRVFHLAYERRFNTRTLDALAAHAQAPAPTPARPRFQAMFCIDDREESLRRHLEEIAPEAETFGAAGFFFVPMYYRGVADAHFVPLCPAVMKPRHWVVEQAVGDAAGAHERRLRARRALGRLSHQFHVGSRSFAVGALLSAAVGVLASVPLVVRTIFPGLMPRLRRYTGRFADTPPPTRLRLERPEDGPKDQAHVGFTLAELTDIAERVLRDTGLTANFAPFVFVLGHGSSSLNNPHESAYDCGACGGARGGPNARALAQILNDPRVRAGLEPRGVRIPADTVFVGGLHNTSSEDITFYDTATVPPARRDDFDALDRLFRAAGERNAHERARRFVSAPLSLSFTGARLHAEGRAEDVAQTRPECGHATNALSFVGRRATTRGLFLDRRAFLTSYDPAQDDPGQSVLTRILSAIFPVCAGINLEYYFSYVDNHGWGSGTKLPHNISALVGVMDGAASDLRTGLPWQMVEIHEPVRLLTVVETSPEAMEAVLSRNPDIGRLCRHGWVHLAVLHPTSKQISVYRDGRFVDYKPQTAALPQAASSVHWYRGWRDHLEFAQIDPGRTGTDGEGTGDPDDDAGAADPAA